MSNLLEQLKQRSPKLVEDTVPALVKPADLQKILQGLLRERVSIRDIETILEALAEWAPRTKDVDVLTEYVRNALRRAICAQHAVSSGPGKLKLVCVTLDPTLEDLINGYVDRGPGGTTVTMPARTAARVADQVVRSLERVTSAGHSPVVIASPQVRAVVRQLVEPHLPGVVVLGYNEIVSGVDVESMALVMPPADESAERRTVAGAA